ncbi:MAG: 16S rRNA (cytosine(967)-C(5))-methyltransferase RsmB [Candidatus Zixiibacteriota bacterium]|nr:MAG: 16S rRNA (cytosine(967)-C(5))-methyltransferase RsmB [candidate division Zixibacteria bacterium]
MNNNIPNSRRIALLALIKFNNTGKDPASILNEIIPSNFPGRDESLVREMTLGTIKYQKRLEYMAQTYIKAPIKQQAVEIRAGLLLGFYQLTEMSSVPDFAAVDETVSAVKNIISEKSAGFVNAVLRAYLMQPKKVRFPDKAKEPLQYLSVSYSYPVWLVKRWLERLGSEETEMLLETGNRRPKIFFKILESKKPSNEVKRILSEIDIDIDFGEYLPDYFWSNDAGKILNHELFTSGYLIVQDESQGVPLYLLDPPPDSAILDLCAAPGGKTIALADRVGKKGLITAVDYNPKRLMELKENVGRTGFKNIEIRENDVLDFNPGEKFKYILLDVPCSGLGTISGNADLRWTKSEKDIMILSDMQKKLLEKTAEFAEDGGVIVYSTCTTEPEEIEHIVYGFLDKNHDFALEDGNSPLVEPFKTETGIYRSWPHRHGIGGGGFARLRRSG